MCFFCLLFMTKSLAPLLFFSSYLIEPRLILHRYFQPRHSSFPHSIHQQCQIVLGRLTNAAAERTSHPCSLLFSTALALFPPSVSTLIGSYSMLSVCSVTWLRCSRLRLQQSRCTWCKVMQNLQDSSSSIWCWMPASDFLITVVYAFTTMSAKLSVYLRMFVFVGLTVEYQCSYRPRWHLLWPRISVCVRVASLLLPLCCVSIKLNEEERQRVRREVRGWRTFHCNKPKGKIMMAKERGCSASQQKGERRHQQHGKAIQMVSLLSQTRWRLISVTFV